MLAVRLAVAAGRWHEGTQLRRLVEENLEQISKVVSRRTVKNPQHYRVAHRRSIRPRTHHRNPRIRLKWWCFHMRPGVSQILFVIGQRPGFLSSSLTAYFIFREPQVRPERALKIKAVAGIWRCRSSLLWFAHIQRFGSPALRLPAHSACAYRHAAS
jgi:hypothetical protein